MKKLLCCLALSVLSACGPRTDAVAGVPAAETFEQECARRLSSTEIHVVALPSAVQYTFSTSMAQLTQRGSRQRNLGQVVLGLTEATLRSQLSWGANYLVEAGSGRACMRPHLTLAFNVAPQLVSVAREFPKGSCAFNEIATHELRHVYANQAQLEVAAGVMQKELTSFFGQKVFYGKQNVLQSQLSEALNTTWMPLAQAELDKVKAAHNAIDSPQEYARNSTVCDGAIAHAVAEAGLTR